MDMSKYDKVKDYIKKSLSELTRESVQDEKIYKINSIYAMLEHKGYERKMVRILIDTVIYNNVLESTATLGKQVQASWNLNKE